MTFLQRVASSGRKGRNILGVDRGGDVLVNTAVNITDYDTTAPSLGHNTHCYFGNLARLGIRTTALQRQSKTQMSLTHIHAGFQILVPQPFRTQAFIVPLASLTRP